MSTKNKHKNRMKDYFIEAAFKLVKNNEALSARKIGELAGYSYATIYNYFKDLDELQWYVIDRLFDDLGEKMKKSDKEANPKDRLININKAYIEYFSENPHIFRFIYDSNLGQPPKELNEKFKMPMMRIKLNQILQECVNEERISEKNLKVISDIISTSNRGLLAMHIANKKMLDKDTLIMRSEKILKYLFKG